MNPETWWAIFGWIGSAVIVFSLLQTNIVWLRVFNLIGCVLAVIYNAPLAIWPSVGLNAALTIINLVQLIRLRRARSTAHADAPSETTGGTPTIIEARSDDGLLRALLEARRPEVEERGGASIEQLLSDSEGARLAFAGDRLLGCALRLRGAEAPTVVYGADMPVLAPAPVLEARTA